MDRFLPHLRLRRTLSVVALATGLGTASTALASKNARLHLQVPVNATNPAKTNLDSIEYYGKTPVFSHNFAIPYAALEKEIQKKFKNLLAAKIPQGKTTEVCTDPCPDVTWWIDYTPTFAFTKKGQPVLTKLGSSSNNKVRAEVEVRAKVRVKGKFHATATVLLPPAIPDEKHAIVPFDLYVEVRIKARADVKLWPDVAVTNVVIDDKILANSPNIELNGAAVDLGVTAGFILGSTPLGLASGGPLVFSSLLGLIGDAAADMAEAEIEKAREGDGREGLQRRDGPRAHGGEGRDHTCDERDQPAEEQGAQDEAARAQQEHHAALARVRHHDRPAHGHARGWDCRVGGGAVLRDQRPGEDQRLGPHTHAGLRLREGAGQDDVRPQRHGERGARGQGRAELLHGAGGTLDQGQALPRSKPRGRTGDRGGEAAHVDRRRRVLVSRHPDQGPGLLPMARFKRRACPRPRSSSCRLARGARRRPTRRASSPSSPAPARRSSTTGSRR